jgi:hypothetical protein
MCTKPVLRYKIMNRGADISSVHSKPNSLYLSACDFRKDEDALWRQQLKLLLTDTISVHFVSLRPVSVKLGARSQSGVT